ncbi:hypothetical protein WD019_06675 [Fictibacillus sp. Mic-4]|uniref:hypothetical protein n=1 Tax=Fictibacillus sp. Mic-4 TaxID=3132826 RepID=UPI003CEB6EBD
MTKVARLYEKEKEEALAQKETEIKKEIARSLLDILAPEMVAKKTGLTIDEVKQLKKN